VGSEWPPEKSKRNGAGVRELGQGQRGRMTSLMLNCAGPARADTDLAHASAASFLLTTEDIDAAIQSTGECNFGRVQKKQRDVFAENVKDIGAFQRCGGTVAARCSFPACLPAARIRDRPVAAHVTNRRECAGARGVFDACGPAGATFKVVGGRCATSATCSLAPRSSGPLAVLRSVNPGFEVTSHKLPHRVTSSPYTSRDALWC